MGVAPSLVGNCKGGVAIGLTLIFYLLVIVDGLVFPILF